MTDAGFWRDKVAQVLHDPFVKAFCQGETAKAVARDLASEALGSEEPATLLWDAFAQDKVGALLSVRLLGEDVVLPDKPVRRYHGDALAASLEAGILPAALQPDHAAAGADRPVLGDSGQVNVRLWREGDSRITVTHPLAAAPLLAPAPLDEAELLAWLRPAYARLDAYRGELPATALERYRQAWYALWRRLPEELAVMEGAAPGGLFWPLQPADTRVPDHSIWDHLRMTSALAFVPATRTADERLAAQNPGKRPWLVSLWVGPARDYVGQARTGRDLWTGSMLLSELAWALAEPIVETLGPDSLLYPDLRANPRADHWIAGAIGMAALGASPARSYAALMPNRLVALVPEAQVSDLAKAAQEGVRQRWKEMAQAVRALIETKVGAGRWTAIFDAQTEQGPNLRWSAVRWQWDGRLSEEYRRTDLHLDPAIPFQRDPPGLPRPLRDLEAQRRARYEEWLPRGVFDHYQAARLTQLMTHPGYLLSQRGFDYPLAHHQLLELDEARARLGWSPGRVEPGEKCTLCGARQALSDAPDGTVGAQRRAARNLWKKLGDEGDGSERLCGVCALRRFLSDTADPIRDVWSSGADRRAGRHSEPFPSTGLICAQRWLQAIAEGYARDAPGHRAAVEQVVGAFKRTDVRETQFPDSLVRTRRLRLAPVEVLDRFLRIDVQHLDPERWTSAAATGERAKASPEAALEMQEACRKLRACAGAPDTRIAVIMLDGDRMGRLLLGEAEAVKARWRDVIHPEAIAGLRSGDQAWKAYWRTTMEQARLMGPSTHAFVTRALREFSNRIIPWVVEREFDGRLIYAGGDDALILCPGPVALALVGRLYDLFTAAWVLDTAPQPLDDDLYDVRRGDEGRFRIVKREDRPEISSGGVYDITGSAGRIVPMMGENQSLSAGVAFGHYKTSLRILRQEAAERQQAAKAAGGARAGLSWFTRNGVKLRAVAPLAAGVDGGLRQLQKLETAFGKDLLPHRLPYKLRERLPVALAIWRSGEPETTREGLVKSLVREALDGAEAHAGLVATAWIAGLRGAGDQPESSLNGLLIARALAVGSGDGQAEAP